jgi:hypothetical protein
MRLLGLLLALAALAAITAHTVRTVEAPPDAGERKIAAADRHLYYVVTSSEGPEFRLAGHERELYIVSHALIAGAPPFDPARQVVYGLELAARVDGREVWKRALYTRSRQSKARREGGLWLDENAFSLERGIEVTDDRLLVARLPDELPAGTLLRFRLAGGGTPEALIRVYQREARPPSRVELRLRSLSPGEREEIASALSFTPWDRLAPGERIARLRSQRVRMSAVGREGEAFRTRALHVTGFRLPLDEEAAHPAALGTLVLPARAAAVNVVGPVELYLQLSRAPAEVPSLVPAAVEIRWIGEGGQPPPLIVPVPPSPTSVTATLSVPAGLHSLHLSTDAREGVRLEMSAPAGSQAQLGVAAAEGMDEILAPHEVLLWGAALSPETPPLVVSVPSPELVARVFRVDARLLPSAAPPESPVAGAVTVETYDAGRRRLTRQLIQLASQVSRFEEVRQGQAGSAPRPVAEPASFRIIAPAAARTIEVHAAQPVFVRAHALATLAPEPDTLDAPFDAVQLSEAVWRYAPYDERTWVPVQPRNRAALAAHEARLAAQVRLEIAPPPSPSTGGVAATVTPEGDPERRVVLERVRPGEAWGPGHQASLRPGRPQKVRFAGAARLSYWVIGPPEVNLGQDVEVHIDGEQVGAFPVTATASSWSLPLVRGGEHTVEVRTSAPNLRLLLDQQPLGGGEVVATRSVYASGQLRLRVNKPTAAPHALNVVVYAPSRDGDLATRFRVRVDGGAPRRLEGVALAQLTPGERTLTLPPADRDPTLGFADAGDRTVYHPRLIAIGLGDDLAAGPHTIDLEPVRGSERTWMRFFVMTTSRPQPERVIQWRLTPHRPGE